MAYIAYVILSIFFPMSSSLNKNASSYCSYVMKWIYQFVMYGGWDSIDTEPIPIDLYLLEGPIGVHPVGIEPTNSPIMSWAL